MNVKSFIKDFFKQMNNIQNAILEAIENESNQDFLSDLINNLDNQKCLKDKHSLKRVLHLISKIAKNHYRCPQFFDKIKLIINEYKKEIQQYYSNWEIFNIFKGNKFIILFLLEQKIIKPTDENYYIIINDKNTSKYYPHYFYPEFINFFDDKLRNKIENDIITLTGNNKIIQNLSVFNERRKIGENDSQICQLIRQDSIDEFIIYVNQTNYFLSSTINCSIFETNGFLLKNKTSLINYAAFHGSIQIFKYLYLNQVPIESSTFLYAIHSQNPIMIHFIEENIDKTLLIKSLYKRAFYESIKCHHNEIASYLYNNKNLEQINYIKCLKKYNFEYSMEMHLDDAMFVYSAKYDFYDIVNFLLLNQDVHINRLETLNHFVFYIIYILSYFI